MLLIWLFFIFTLFQHSLQKKYLFVYEHVRHGIRSPPFDPSSSYTDEYGTEWFGDGELTNLGIRMHYVIGIRNRLKYPDLLSPVFNSKEIIITSTNSNRTISSIQAELLAMYPPGRQPKITEDEKPLATPPITITDEIQAEITQLELSTTINDITIIPIHTFNIDDKYVFLNEPSVCPAMTTYSKKWFNKSNIINIWTRIQGEYGTQLVKYFKMPSIDAILDFNTIISITDNYIVNLENGKDLSSFLSETGIDKNRFYDYAIELKTAFLYETKCDSKTCTMASSPIMRDVLTWMNLRIEMDKDGKSGSYNYTMPKMVIHGGHDTTVAPIQLCFNSIFETKYYYVGFASNIFLELYKDDNGVYRVTYLIDDKEMFDIEFNEFERRLKEELWTRAQIEDFCGFNNEGTSSVNKLILSVCVLGATTLMFMIMSIVLFWKTWKQRKEQKNKRKNDEICEQVEPILEDS